MNKRILRSFLMAFLFSFALIAKASSVNKLFHHASDPIVGNPHGKVTVVEFFDYQCSHCSKMVPVLSSIIKNNPDVRFIFKDYPIRGQYLAARAAIAANSQGKYYDFYRALFAASKAYSENSIIEIANATGLDSKKLKRDMKNKVVNRQLNSTISLARELRVTGTPSFFIGKTDAKSNKEIKYVLGEMTPKALQDAINAANG